MREEASFHMFIEKDAQTEFVSKAEEYYSQFFYQIIHMVIDIQNRFKQKKTTLKPFRQWKYCF